MKDLKYYLNLKYTVKIIPDKDFDGSIYYIAKYEELGGLVGTGDSESEALRDLEEAKEGWFELNLELGRPIPEPKKHELTEAIKITYRIPNSLNSQIEIFMEKENVSKNTAISLLIQSGLHHETEKDMESLYSKMMKNLIGTVINSSSSKKTNLVRHSLNVLDTVTVHETGDRYSSPRNNKYLEFNH